MVGGEVGSGLPRAGVGKCWHCPSSNDALCLDGGEPASRVEEAHLSESLALLLGIQLGGAGQLAGGEAGQGEVVAGGGTQEAAGVVKLVADRIDRRYGFPRRSTAKCAAAEFRRSRDGIEPVVDAVGQRDLWHLGDRQAGGRAGCQTSGVELVP